MDNRAIGIFDSGLGGLTAVKEFISLMPNENIVYFGDTGRVPYGTRSDETIIKYVKQDINFLKSFDVKMIVAACGTASSVAIDLIKDTYDIDVIGVVNPSIETAINKTKNKKIGIIATSGTINSGAYSNKILKLDNSIVIKEKSCPLFVPLVENGYIDNEVVRLVAEEYLQEVKNANVDTLILGCTHYPLLIKVISDIMGKNTQLIDTGKETAKYVFDILKKKDLLSDTNEKGICRYFVSDDTDKFACLGSLFMGSKIDDSVEKIDIEKW